MPDNPAAPPTPAAPKKKMSTPMKLMIIIGAVMVIGLAIVAAYIYSIASSTPLITPPAAYGVQQLSASIYGERLLPYNLGSNLLPYLLLSYNSDNISTLNITATLYRRPPPTTIYVLQYANQCYNCYLPSQQDEIVGSLTANLIRYGVLRPGSRILNISEQNVSIIPANTTLVILNGLMPDYLAENGTGTGGGSLLLELLQRGVSVVYVGGNFSHLVSYQSVVVPNPYIPPFLQASPYSYSGGSAGNPFILNQTLYTIGKNIGPVSYEQVNGGELLAFPEYPNRWPSPVAEGQDIAKLISMSFWLGNYTSGNTNVTLQNASASSGILPFALQPYVLLNQTAPSYEAAVAELENSSGRLVLAGSSSTGNSIYRVIYFKPSFFVHGVISIPSNITPAQAFNATITMFVNGSETIEPHFNIFNSHLNLVASLPPLFTNNVQPPYYSFVQPVNLNLAPGGYIAELAGFSNQNYATAFFNIPNVSIGLESYSFNTSTFIFSIGAGGVPLSGLNATVTLNGQYKQNLSVVGGGMSYSLPPGLSLPTGQLLFNIHLLSNNYTYPLAHAPTAITINRQYIEFIFALLIVIIEITIIKAPARDDFYVDVSSMPRPPSSKVKVKYMEFLGVFDKLNNYYHWRYMPLTKAEFRLAVSSNMHYQAMPILLTYQNIDMVLDQLVEKGYLVSADEQYAPKAWLEQSKHGIEYLTTFKKLRLSLVSHGHVFTDLDKSDLSDIVTTLHNERAYIVIYAQSSKFKKIPVYPNSNTYIAFLNEDKMEAFRRQVYSSTSREAEELKMYMSVGRVVLIDADNPEGILT